MRSKNDRIIAGLMLTPSIIFLGIFVYVFIFQTINTSLTDWGRDPSTALLENPPIEGVGMENYQSLMTDVIEFNFRNSLINTFFFTLFFVLGCLVVGFLMAILLDQKIAGEWFFRTTFLFPMALSFMVTGTIWRWMLQPDGGINLLPQILFGLEPLDFSWTSSREVWLGFTWGDVPMYITFAGLAILGFLAVNYVVNRNMKPLGYLGAIAAILVFVYVAGLWERVWLPLDDAPTEGLIAPKGFNSALLGVVIAAIWQMSGYVMAMFLAGIRGVPEELREAARVDGCTEVGVYYRIVLPQLKPIILSAVIVLGHISLKIFDLVFAMAGPDNAQTIVPGILVYTEGFRANNFAVASSVAVIMLFFVALVIIPYLWSQLRESRS
jgi:glucose/mannose transport system permease protein